MMMKMKMMKMEKMKKTQGKRKGEKDRIVEDDGEHSKSIPGALSSTVIVWLRFSMLPFILGHLISP